MRQMLVAIVVTPNEDGDGIRVEVKTMYQDEDGTNLKSVKDVAQVLVALEHAKTVMMQKVHIEEPTIVSVVPSLVGVNRH